MEAQEELKVTGYGLSHVGRVRRRNEDSLGIDADGRFALVADGMGGHKGGQEASRMTIRAVGEALNGRYDEMASLSNDEIRLLFREIFQDTSRAVFAAGENDPTLAGMGTTLVSWIRLGKHFHLTHVGDSRAYLFRDGGIFQMTMDHSYVNEQIAMGSERNQLFAGQRFKNAIFRNIGMMPPSEPVTVCGECKKGDFWLLCSDGLSNKMNSADMLSIVEECRASAESSSVWMPLVAQNLVELALERGGEDNITVLLFALS
jgi:serine/threonine protein phosphatase PrpC